MLQESFLQAKLFRARCRKPFYNKNCLPHVAGLHFITYTKGNAVCAVFRLRKLYDSTFFVAIQLRCSPLMLQEECLTAQELIFSPKECRRQ